MRKPKVVYGAGVCESLCSTLIEKLAEEERSVFTKNGMNAFADALMEIPATLANNSGMDPFTTVNQLKYYHRKGFHTFVFILLYFDRD